MEHLVLAHDSEIEAIDVSKAVAPVLVEGKMEKRERRQEVRELRWEKERHKRRREGSEERRMKKRQDKGHKEGLEELQ